MFFLVERKDTLALHPRHFNSSLSSLLLTQLRHKVEGKCSGRYGYTILVTMLRDVGVGVLDPDTGYAHFPVSYLALVFRPFKNEILIAKVTTVNNVSCSSEHPAACCSSAGCLSLLLLTDAFVTAPATLR
jgi:DNA-directed RNA polymerase II subunit RPB7